MRIYIAGPYSAPPLAGRAHNIEVAIAAGVAIIQAGHTLFIPQLSHYVHEFALTEDQETPYQKWLALDMEWLRLCDAILMLGKSPGANLELDAAKRIGLKIFWRWDDIPHVCDGSCHDRP